MRLRSEVWVSAFLRNCGERDAMAVVARRGDRDAGIINILVPIADGRVRVYGPAPAGLLDAELRRSLVPVFDPPDVDRSKADEYVAGQAAFDPDLWIIELEYCRDVDAIDALVGEMSLT